MSSHTRKSSPSRSPGRGTRKSSPSPIEPASATERASATEHVFATELVSPIHSAKASHESPKQASPKQASHESPTPTPTPTSTSTPATATMDSSAEYWIKLSVNVKQKLNEVFGELQPLCAEFKAILKGYNGVNIRGMDLTDEGCIIGYIIAFITFYTRHLYTVLLKGSSIHAANPGHTGTLNDLDYVIVPIAKKLVNDPTKHKMFAYRLTELVIEIVNERGLLGPDTMLINTYTPNDKEIAGVVSQRRMYHGIHLTESVALTDQKPEYRDVNANIQEFLTDAIHEMNVVKLVIVKPNRFPDKFPGKPRPYEYFPVAEFGFGLSEADPYIKQLFSSDANYIRLSNQSVTERLGPKLVNIACLSLPAFISEKMYNIWLAFRKNEVYTPQNFRYIQKSIISILSYNRNIQPLLDRHRNMNINYVRELTTIFIRRELEQLRLERVTLDTMPVGVEIRFYSLIIQIMSMFFYCLSSLERDRIREYMPNNISECMRTVVYKLIEELHSHDLFYTQYLEFDWTRDSLTPFMAELDTYVKSGGRSSIPIQSFFEVSVYVMPPQPLVAMMESTGAFRGKKGKHGKKQGK